MPDPAKVTAVNGSRRRALPVMKIGYHGSEEGLKHLGYQLFSIGNRADGAHLPIKWDYVLDGYVKKAGTNFVLPQVG